MEFLLFGYLAASGPGCGTQDPFLWLEGFSLGAVRGRLILVASLVAEHEAQRL